MRIGIDNSRKLICSILQGVVLLLLPISVTAVTDREPPKEFSWEMLQSPEKSLNKLTEPWRPLERLLEAGDRAAGEKFLAGLTPKQEETRRRANYLLKLFDGDYLGAGEELSGIDSADDWTVYQKRYLDGLAVSTQGFVEAGSDHFRVRSTETDSFLTQYALPALEKAYTKMAEAFKTVPSTSVLVEIYPTAERFSAASTLPEETLERSGAIGICKFRRLMIISPQATPLGYRWLDALAHEYMHFLINQVSGTLCPLWLHEGVSRYYETAWRRSGGFSHSAADETRLAAAATQESAAESPEPESVSSRLIPFKRMEPSMVYLENQDQVSLAFTEVADAVGFIVERHGEEKLLELLSAFRRLPREQAFRNVLGMGEEELETAWRDSLAGREWKLSKGAMPQTIHLRRVEEEEEFVGADARGHVRLGDRLRQQKEFQAALLQYRKALEQEPNNGVALSKLARTELVLGREEKAEGSLRLAVAKNPSYVTPFVMLGELLYDQGRYDEAQPVLEEALEINPYHPHIHELLGLIGLDLGNFKAARHSIEQALRLDPSNKTLRDTLDRMPQ